MFISEPIRGSLTHGRMKEVQVFLLAIDKISTLIYCHLLKRGISGYGDLSSR